MPWYRLKLQQPTNSITLSNDNSPIIINYPNFQYISNSYLPTIFGYGNKNFFNNSNYYNGYNFFVVRQTYSSSSYSNRLGLISNGYYLNKQFRYIMIDNPSSDFLNYIEEIPTVTLNGKYIIKHNIADILPNIKNNLRFLCSFINSTSSITSSCKLKIDGYYVFSTILSSSNTNRNYNPINNSTTEVIDEDYTRLKFMRSNSKGTYNFGGMTWYSDTSEGSFTLLQLSQMGNVELEFNNCPVHSDFVSFLLEIADSQDQIVLTFGDSIVLANKPVTEINVVKKTLNLVDVTIDGTTSEVEIHPQEGKVFLGFSLQEGSTVATIPIGTTKITLNENTTFYEVWGTYKPEPNFFTANFYQNSAENHRVDKTEYLTSIFSAGISLREETNIVHPTIILQYDKVPDFNYCYIEYFGRYYYVTDIISIRNNIWQINLSVDVLMSFKDIIKTQNGNIIRQENIGNTSMPDNQIPVTGIPKIQFLEFSQPSIILDNDVANAFDGDRTSINYVLITQGVGFIE